MGEYEYRLRWDDVKYQPGQLKVVAYKDDEKWAEDVVKTTGTPAGLEVLADRSEVKADGKDLTLLTVKVKDKKRLTVPTADNNIRFSTNN